MTALITERGICNASVEGLASLYPERAKPPPEGRARMKSRWRSREAERLVRAYKRRGVNGIWRCACIRRACSDGTPRSYCTAGQYVGQDDHAGFSRRARRRVVRQGQRLGHGRHRAPRPSRAADRRTAQVAASRLAFRRGNGQFPARVPPRLDVAQPSVETLLHAFLPHKYVDHTHSTAVLAVTDQPDGAALCREVFGGRVALVPYVMPGFALARTAAGIHDANIGVEGLILLKHGIFTFGDTAREAYERMIDLVSLAEARLRRGPRERFKPSRVPPRVARASEVGPIIRGLLAESVNGAEAEWRRAILDFRTDKRIRTYVDGEDIARYSQVGVVTPDHAIRTKNWPLVVPVPTSGDLTAFKRGNEERVARYVRRYHAYFGRHNGMREPAKVELDPYPRVVLVPGLGLFGAGKSVSDAGIAADIAGEHIEVITDAEAIGRYQPVGEADVFDIEYWSLEQAKLGKGAEPPFRGRSRWSRGAVPGSGRRPPESSRRTAPPSRSSTGMGHPRKPSPGPSVKAPSGSHATSPIAARCAAPSIESAGCSAVSTSWCPTRARRGRGGSGTSPTVF